MDNTEGGLDYLREVILNDSPGSPTSWSRRWPGWWRPTSANGKPPLTILTAALFRTAVNVPTAEEQALAGNL